MEKTLQSIASLFFCFFNTRPGLQSLIWDVLCSLLETILNGRTDYHMALLCDSLGDRMGNFKTQNMVVI
jgi:hypothetical protein